jgi:hypothetical protein
MQARFLFLVLFLAAPCSYALQVQTQEQAAKEPEPPAEQNKAAKPARTQTGMPSSTFTPSEKIQADSAVSFPVDI